MATFADTIAPAGFNTRFGAIFKGFADRLVQKRLYRETVRELEALTSNELRDLGVDRADIPMIARSSVYSQKV